MKLLTREDEFGAERFAEGERHMQHEIYERLVAHGMPEQEASMMTGWIINPVTL